MSQAVRRGDGGRSCRDRLELSEDDVEIFKRLFGQSNSANDKQHALGTASEQEAANERGAEQGLARACGHFEQEFAQSPRIERGREDVDGLNLVAPQNKVELERLQPVRGD